MSKSSKNSVPTIKAPRESKAQRAAREAAEANAKLAAEQAQREQAEREAAEAAQKLAAEQAAKAVGVVVKKEHANGAAFTKERPGVLATIENMLRGATAENPISKVDMLASLVVAFADRDEAKMKVTLAMQVPSGFKIEKGYIISKVEGRGYYFDTEKTAAYQLTHEKRGGKWVPKTVVPTETK